MNRIKDPTKVPNAGEYGVGFIYRDPDSGRVFVHATVDQVVVMARKHREANNYSLSPNFRQDVIENVCSNQPELCFDEPAPSVLEKFSAVGKALVASARGGFKTLSVEQVEDRQKICESSGINGAACEYFKGLNGMFKVMCGKCGCAALKIHLKTSQCPKGLWPEL